MIGIYAIGLYDTMSKQETFAFYANVIYFGHGANGLYQAAEKYFGRTPSELNAGDSKSFPQKFLERINHACRYS
ncbi:transglycosylase domain-containing protein [Desulfosporosinus acididurans]|uniref:transglycosylase domain-containing protein n=1 Tax=Desulfosporosinus acididurans TaxID=476652 RepID=UPI000AE1A292|nr:transglycosylase domain-containing protein [Desulfosporosinus acididurans]